jgi:hypothetical protein
MDYNYFNYLQQKYTNRAKDIFGKTYPNFPFQEKITSIEFHTWGAVVRFTDKDGKPQLFDINPKQLEE